MRTQLQSAISTKHHLSLSQIWWCTEQQSLLAHCLSCVFVT